MRLGTVTLVGAGPGHADFMTIAGLKAIQAADIILFDALIAADIRQYFPKKAKAFYVGKRCGQHALRQDQINERLVHYAKRGLDVVRLKGGDPFVFGRGAEEIESLRAEGIPYRIIPGVSALNGIAAQLALPLTARTHSNEFRAIQGHSLSDDPLFWKDLARYQGTLVIFMGLENLPRISQRLREAGADADKALAVIETDEDGQTHVTRSQLGLVSAKGFARKTKGPGIVYLGPNVELMDLKPTAYAAKEASYDAISAHIS